MLRQFSKITAAVVLAVSSQSNYAASPPCVLAPSACVAPVGGDGDSRHTENRVYAGVNWTLGGKQGLVPQLVLGARSLRVKSSDSVSGGDLNLRLNVFNGFSIDSLRLSYVGGNRDVQGNIGGGYSFVDSKLLGTAAVQANYSRIGADYVFGSSVIRPYAEINSLQKPKNVGGGGALGCPSGYTLGPIADSGASGSQTSNGLTCQQPVI